MSITEYLWSHFNEVLLNEFQNNLRLKVDCTHSAWHCAALQDDQPNITQFLISIHTLHSRHKKSELQIFHTTWDPPLYTIQRKRDSVQPFSHSFIVAILYTTWCSRICMVGEVVMVVVICITHPKNNLYSLIIGIIVTQYEMPLQKVLFMNAVSVLSVHLLLWS
jgi:hypothetical protein